MAPIFVVIQSISMMDSYLPVHIKISNNSNCGTSEPVNTSKISVGTKDCHQINRASFMPLSSRKIRAISLSQVEVVQMK